VRMRRQESRQIAGSGVDRLRTWNFPQRTRTKF
jgi:hypothetical protein